MLYGSSSTTKEREEASTVINSGLHKEQWSYKTNIRMYKIKPVKILKQEAPRITNFNVFPVL